MQIDQSEVVWLDEHHEISMDELIEISGLSFEELNNLVETGVLVPNNPTDNNLHFNNHCIISIRTLSRLKHDFELEPNAFALMLIFLERIRTLEFQLSNMERAQK